jgi:hypothetical protein
MRSHGGRAFHGKRSVPKGRGRRPSKSIAILRDELVHSKELLMAAIRDYKAALRRYRAAVEARFGKH